MKIFIYFVLFFCTDQIIASENPVELDVNALRRNSKELYKLFSDNPMPTCTEFKSVFGRLRVSSMTYPDGSVVNRLPLSKVDYGKCETQQLKNHEKDYRFRYATLDSEGRLTDGPDTRQYLTADGLSGDIFIRNPIAETGWIVKSDCCKAKNLKDVLKLEKTSSCPEKDFIINTFPLDQKHYVEYMNFSTEEPTYKPFSDK